MYVNDSESSSGQMCDVIYRTPLQSQFDIAIIQQNTRITNSSENDDIKFGKAVEGTTSLVSFICDIY